MTIKPAYAIAGAAVVAALVWLAMRNAKSVGAGVASVAIDLVDGAVSETVYTIGDAVGIPRTDKTECQRRVEEFNAAPWYEQAVLSFGISAHCSTTDYFRFLKTGKGPLQP